VIPFPDRVEFHNLGDSHSHTGNNCFIGSDGSNFSVSDLVEAVGTKAVVGDWIRHKNESGL
jgi:hypothetical protein